MQLFTDLPSGCQKSLQCLLILRRGSGPSSNDAFLRRGAGGFRIPAAVDMVVFGPQTSSRITLLALSTLVAATRSSTSSQACRRSCPAFHHALQPRAFVPGLLRLRSSINSFNRWTKHKYFQEIRATLPPRVCTPRHPAENKFPSNSKPGTRPNDPGAEGTGLPLFRTPPGVLVPNCACARVLTNAWLKQPQASHFHLLVAGLNGLLSPLRAASARQKEQVVAENIKAPKRTRTVTRGRPAQASKQRFYLVFFEPRDSWQRPKSTPKNKPAVRRKDSSPRIWNGGELAERAISAINQYAYGLNEELEVSKKNVWAKGLQSIKGGARRWYGGSDHRQRGDVHRNVELGKLNADLINFQPRLIWRSAAGTGLTIRRSRPGRRAPTCWPRAGRPVASAQPQAPDLRNRLVMRSTA